MNQNYFEPNLSYSGFDQPSQYPIDQSPPKEMSIQDMEDLKQQYLDEMKSMINQIQIKDYRNERIDIRYRRECEIKIDEFKGKFNGMSIKINKKKELRLLEQIANESTIPLNEIISQLSQSIAITPILPTMEPEDSLIMEDEHLRTILEKELDEFIKSSVEDLVPIPSESEDTSWSDKNIESKDSYVSNLDEPALLVTPLFDDNEDECFDPGSDVDEIEFLLHRDPSTPKISIASILEGFTDEPPPEENDDLFDLESKENEWKNILYDALIDDFMTEDKVFDPGM
ncbi:hypothetical protein Tco_0814858 [Tanacetum coccineum]